MREAALVPLPAIAGSEEAAPGDSGLLARGVVASAVGVAVARLGVVRLAAGLVVAVLGVGVAVLGGGEGGWCSGLVSGSPPAGRGDAAGERRVATALARTTVTVSCRACCVEARGPVSCRVPRGWRKGRVRRSAGGLPPAEGVPLGGAALAGEGAVSQYSPVRRVIVSCRGARARVVSGAAGAGSRATFAARPVGFRRTRGAGCRLAEWGGWTVTWIVELGTLAGAADERRGGRRRLRDAVGPGAAARGDDLVVADEEVAQRLLHEGEH